MVTPITYYGGKQSLVSDILPLIPDHQTFVEPFFGGGAVFFAKPKSPVEVINDNNRFVINFYEQARSNFEELQKRVRQTPHARALYRDALVMYQHPHLFNEIEKAWAFWVLTNCGHSSKIGSWGYGTTSASRERGIKNKRDHFVEELRDRLDMTQVESLDALYVIERRDRPTTFFYIDPPYFNSNMGHYGGYTEADFEALLRLCGRLQGKFLLSSYPSEILKKHTEKNGWHQIEVSKRLVASPTKRMKTEVLTANFPITLPGPTPSEAEK